jgi:branched-chain amino acid transport system ATP-binding protein
MKQSCVPIWVGGEKLLLEAKNLTVRYGTVKALEDVSFKLHEGEIVAMIGPNGAGKSTALKALSGVLEATDGCIENGEILFEGKSIKGFRTDELVKKGISLVPEGRRVFPTMTVWENLEMGAYTRIDKKSIKEDIDKVCTMFPHLMERRRQRAGVLSSGEQQMLAIGRALMLKPKLLMADEPSLGLSPNYVDIVFDTLLEINRSGMSILIVEQNARMALDICTRGYVFDIGRIALEGERAELLKNERVKTVFLGG